MSLISVLEAMAHKLPFATEDEKNAFHEQIHALGDEAVTDVKTLVHGVEADVAQDVEMTFGNGAPEAPVDPLAGLSDDELEAEIAKRKAAQGQ